jgi:hypothetical protein
LAIETEKLLKQNSFRALNFVGGVLSHRKQNHFTNGIYGRWLLKGGVFGGLFSRDICHVVRPRIATVNTYGPIMLTTSLTDDVFLLPTVLVD